MQGFPNGDIGGQVNFWGSGVEGEEGAPGACLKQMFGLEKVFICCHPANPTLEVATHNILLDL